MSPQSPILVATRMNAAREELMFEAIPTPGIPVQMANTGPVSRIDKSFDEVVQVIGNRIKSSFQSFWQMMNDMKADEVEVKFGIKLTAEAGIVVTSIATEGSIEVTLTFKSEKARAQSPM